MRVRAKNENLVGYYTFVTIKKSILNFQDKWFNKKMEERNER